MFGLIPAFGILPGTPAYLTLGDWTATSRYMSLVSAVPGLRHVRVGLLALAISGARLSSPGELSAPAGATRVVTGKVIGSISGEPISGAFVTVVGTAASATAAEGGRFVLRDVPAHSVQLTAFLFGYRDTTYNLEPGSDSVDLRILLREPQPRSPVSGSFLELVVEERRAIWAALLRGLSGTTDAIAGHLAQVERVASGSGYVAPASTGRAVLHLPPGSLPDMDDEEWHLQLIQQGAIDRVCREPRALDCAIAGFRIYVMPSRPGRFATDSVVVDIEYTAIDAALCRQGRSMGDTGTDSRLLYRRDGRWYYAGLDETLPRMIGGLHCGQP